MALLTVDELKARIRTTLPDSVLQDYLAAAEAAIDAMYGAVGDPVTELVDGGLTYLTLRRRAATVDTITERTSSTSTITLAADDYLIRTDRRSIQRLSDGTHASGGWAGLVTLVYTPEDNTAERKRVQEKLVELDINATPGASSEQIGAWMEQHQESSVWNYESQRQAILDSLYPVAVLDFA